MEIKTTVGLKSNVLIEAFKASSVKRSPDGDIVEGEIVARAEIHNMNVNAGLNFMRAAISRAVTVMGYIAAGTGSTGAAAGDTTLETEIDRVAILSYDDPSTGAVRFRAIYESNQANGNLREFGIFNDATTGTMLARTVLGAAFTKDESLIVRVNWTVTFADT